MFYLYCLQNKVNNKIYIGQTVNIKNRMSYHKLCKKPYPLYYSIKKHGWNNFNLTILEEYETLEEINEAEIFYIAYLNSQNREIGYNLAPGGNGYTGKIPWNKGLKGIFKQSEEHKKKLLESGGNRGNRYKCVKLSISKRKFTLKQEKEIISLIGTMSNRELGKKYGCHYQTINNIAKRHGVSI